jgi:Streptomycin adenylyltransferase
LPYVNNQDFCAKILYDPQMQAERIIQTIAAWAKTRPAIQAAALVGSQARGVARPDSDIDIVLLVTAPETFRVDTGWLHEIGWNLIGARPARWVDEDYGALWSRRLWLEPAGDEIEFGFALPSWAETSPIDPGTSRVIADGCRSLHDPQGRLSRLCNAVREQGG